VPKEAKAVRPKYETVSRSARLSKQIDSWLAGKIESGEYRNYSQAIAGELQKVKDVEEGEARRKSCTVCEPTLTYDQDAYIRKQIADVLEEMREAVLKGGGKKRKG
jgi:Arc/MetJ-type ribon-helix-helix transcriptional regulator